MPFLRGEGDTKNKDVAGAGDSLELCAAGEEVEEEFEEGAEEGEEGVHVNNMLRWWCRFVVNSLQRSSLQVSSFNNYNGAPEG